LKQNETRTDPRRKHPRNARVIYAEELGTMSKNNVRGITLGIRHMGDLLSYLDNLLPQWVKIEGRSFRTYTKII